MPFLNRVVEVAASPTGAFAALRRDPPPPPIDRGSSTVRTIQYDMENLETWLACQPDDERGDNSFAVQQIWNNADEDETGPNIESNYFSRLLRAVNQIPTTDDPFPSRQIPTLKGANIAVISSLTPSPIAWVHLSIMCARSEILRVLVLGEAPNGKHEGNVRISYVSSPQGSSLLGSLHFAGTHPLSILILMHYLYTDAVIAIWDRRIWLTQGKEYRQWEQTYSIPIVKAELQVLAKLLGLPALFEVIQFATQRTPTPTLSADLTKTWIAVRRSQFQTVEPIPDPDFTIPCDLILRLSAHLVYCSSAVLRARSPFFEALLNDPDWTRKRWQPIETAHGTINTLVINLDHLEWRSMEYVLRFMCNGVDDPSLLDDVGEHYDIHN